MMNLMKKILKNKLYLNQNKNYKILKKKNKKKIIVLDFLNVKENKIYNNLNQLHKNYQIC